MRKLILLLSFVFTGIVCFATIIPTLSNPGNPRTEAITRFASMKMKEVEKCLGRKLSFSEKVAIKLTQWKIRKKGAAWFEKKAADKGKTALLFGIAGLVFLLIPVPYLGGLISIASIVLALVLGYQAKKANPKDKNAKAAIILGWVGVGLIIAAFILVIAIIASLGGGWG
ncbi:MAG: hypothetical protein NTW29_14355 [Bacteroidetes bacterium]|nr:hypothetical protein [Bacteroidota bacterium]